MRFRLLPDTPLGWTPYAWLIYLSIYIAWGVFTITSPWEGLIQGLALIVFLALYFRAFWERGPRLLAIAFAIVAIGVIVSPRNPGGSVFFIYGASFLGEAVRPAVAMRWLLVIVAILGFEAAQRRFRAVEHVHLRSQAGGENRGVRSDNPGPQHDHLHSLRYTRGTVRSAIHSFRGLASCTRGPPIGKPRSAHASSTAR